MLYRHSFNIHTHSSGYISSAVLLFLKENVSLKKSDL